MKTFLTSILLTATLSTATAQSAAVQSPEQFLGYPIGARFTPHHRILDYFRALEKASPLLSIEQYGETYEGRPLVYAVIASPKQRAMLDSIRKSHLDLSRPDRITEEQARILTRSTPLVVWLAFGVHGNETSSAETAMLVAHRLLDGTVESQRILDSSLVILDPLQNPDGHERYVSWFVTSRGLDANTNPDSAEHTEPWPGGRYNHYLIDLNRDWAWGTQLETRQRVEAYRRWNPEVFVDFHEMSAESTYFFPPDADPVNANLPREMHKWRETFGRANADAFGKRSWPFFVKETYDLFYPGYGDSWPSLRGAIGMTYEAAGGGRAGSLYERPDSSLLSLADRTARHFTTAMATLETAVANREELLRYRYESLRNAMQQGKTTYCLLPSSPNFLYVINTLRWQGIEVEALRAPATVKGVRLESELPETRQLPAGTALVRTNQPLGKLAEALLERSPLLDKTFLEEQQERVEEDDVDQFYDVTSWSLPIAANVETLVAKGNLELTSDSWPDTPAPPTFRAARFGYLISAADPAIYSVAGALLRNKVRFSVATESFRTEREEYPRGSLLIVKHNTDARLESTLASIAASARARLTPLDTGWSGETSFGSSRFRFVKEPRIAILSGAATNPPSFGTLWYTLDVDARIPHSVVRSERFASLDLSRYNVLVLPDGEGYADAFRKPAVEALSAWVRAGGTLIAIKGAAAFLRSKEVELSKVKEWTRPKKSDEPPAEERYNDVRISGAAFRTRMSARSYLTFGLPRPPAVLIEGSKSLLPLPHRADNVLTIEQTNPVASGFVFPESLERISGALFLGQERVGKGSVITFADEPNFRLFWRGTMPALLNAVLYSPSFQ